MIQFKFAEINRKDSYHNHSSWSDGASSLEDICRRGKAIGLRHLGISDHWVEASSELMKTPEWSLELEKLDQYVETLLLLKHELDDDEFTLHPGLEVDFFFENVDEVVKKLRSYPLDYLIGSVHYAGIFGIDNNKSDWLPLDQRTKDEICEEYWKKLEGAAACGKFDFLGHLDLPKKFGMIENSKYTAHACRVLDAARKSNTAIELNTAGWFKECREQYPSQIILQAAYDRQIPVVISADAHHPDHLVRGFSEAADLLVQTGYKLC